MENKKTIERLAEWGVSPDRRQLELLDGYARLVLKKNQDMNLTAADNGKEIWERHIADSLALLPLLRGLPAERGVKIADCGAGAGFIGIGLAIMVPEAEITLIESVSKKCSFMNWAIASLGLKNAEVASVRLEKSGAPAAHAGVYDIVVERAMGRLGDIFKPCLSLLKPGGKFIAYRGVQDTRDESPAKPEIVRAYKLPCDEKERTLLVFTGTTGA